MSVVRDNLINEKGYTPYCGGTYKICGMPRTRFNGEQFECPYCDFKTNFEKEFIDRYKLKWGLNK